VNHLEQVQAARAALKDHQENHDVPAPGEDFLQWWNTRLGLIESLLSAERAAIDAGVLSDYTAEF
jgi:hypothetical protein